jgi:NADPH-dependent curcumin reductase CurA
MEVVTNRITMTGFIVFDFIKDWPAATKELTEAVKDGRIKTENSETIVETKFEDIPKTWCKLFEGVNQGKLITQIV